MIVEIIHWVLLKQVIKMQKKLLVVTKLFNIAVNYFDAKKSACYSRILVVTELVVSGIQCSIISLPRARE